jgi:hypothetical protein
MKRKHKHVMSMVQQRTTLAPQSPNEGHLKTADHFSENPNVNGMRVNSMKGLQVQSGMADLKID